MLTAELFNTSSGAWCWVIPKEQEDQYQDWKGWINSLSVIPPELLYLIMMDKIKRFKIGHIVYLNWNIILNKLFEIG